MKPYTVTFLWLKFTFPTISISLSGIYLHAFIKPQKKYLMCLSRGFPHSSVGKESVCNAGDLDLIPGLEDPLEKEMATHSSILSCRIPWTEEPSKLQSIDLEELDMT